MNSKSLIQLLKILPVELRVCLDRTYFAETENWKHCSKIIFKCVNSAVWPIFNEKVAEKWNLWVYEQCTDALFTGKSQHLRLLFMHCSLNSSRIPPKTREKKRKKKRKEKKNENAASPKRRRSLSAIQTSTNNWKSRTHFCNIFDIKQND